MRKKVFLETDEYDIFMFPVPDDVIKGNELFATIFPRKDVKEWVISWMQKLHPCFDGRFLSDIKFYREKGKVMALVTVAEKMKVASHLVKKNTAVYVCRPDKRRVFAGNVSGRRFWLASAFAAALVMATLSGFALSSDSRVSREPDILHDVQIGVPSVAVAPQPDAALQSAVVVQPPSCELAFGESVADEHGSCEQVSEVPVTDEQCDMPVSSGEAVLPDETEMQEWTALPELSSAPEIQAPPGIFGSPSISGTPFIDEFISALTEGGCRISSFRWQTEPYASAVMSVEGGFPEDIYACAEKLCGDLDSPENENLPNLSFSSISYADNVPSFSVVLDYSRFETAADALNARLSSSEAEHSVLPAQALFRKLIVGGGGNVTTESVEPPSVSGVIPGKSWKSFSEEVSHIFAAKEVGGIASVLLETLPSNDVSVSTSFDSAQTSFFPLEHVSLLFPENSEHGNESFSGAPSDTELAQESAFEPENLLALQSEPQNETQHDIAFISMCQIGSVCMGGNVYVKFYRDYDGKIFKGEPYEKN